MIQCEFHTNYLCLVTGAQADDLVGLPGGVAPLARGTESPVLLGGNRKFNIKKSTSKIEKN